MTKIQSLLKEAWAAAPGACVAIGYAVISLIVVGIWVNYFATGLQPLFVIIVWFITIAAVVRLASLYDLTRSNK